MDGAVMEGPLFLQSQRFGTKVVCLWRGGWRNPSLLEVGERIQKEGRGRKKVGTARRQLQSPKTFL